MEDLGCWGGGGTLEWFQGESEEPLFPLPKQQVEGGSLLCTGRGPKHLEKRAGGGREDRLCAPSLGGGEGEGKRGGRG